MRTISVIKKLVNFGVISLLGFNLFIGCVKLVPDLSETYTIDFQMNLPLDYNGYYHLSIDRTKWQTLHRVSGVVKDGMNNMVEGFWVEWDSDLYWYLGDNSCYVVHFGYNDEWVKIAYDTTYVTSFTGLEVPTSNRISYSNSYGQINNMIAPTRNMVGDTLTLTAYWFGGSDSFKIVLE